MAEAQKGFPKSAEKKISRLEVEAANGFNDVRAKGQEFVKSLTDQYLEKAQSSTQAAESEMVSLDKCPMFKNLFTNIHHFLNQGLLHF